MTSLLLSNLLQTADELRAELKEARRALARAEGSLARADASRKVMPGRLAALRTRVELAEAAVADFERENGALVTSGSARRLAIEIDGISSRLAAAVSEGAFSPEVAARLSRRVAASFEHVANLIDEKAAELERRHDAAA